ncbi:MAG: ABC transporter ATP-binding protein [Verrucomicrobia bacterium]|nr:ABC transporter ATP-binding protein [Verrucomicrobiota bacterium]
MIELQHVTKRFGGRLAVDDVSLRVPAGEIYGLLGHNGAGKSTVIGMMLGQVWPTRGHVRVSGFDIATQRRQALRNVGAIFETPAFYDYLSGWRNLQILSAYTAPTPPERLREVTDWVGLSARIRSKVRTYSHGMRARLAIAQALLPAPRLLILDEPGEGLDPEGIHEMRQTILRLHRELGLTLLLSSHLLGEVEQLCTRISVLNQGRLLFEGPLPQARAAGNWVRLRTASFPDTTRRLFEARLIIAAGDGHRVQLAPGVPADELVRRLVQWEVAVFEVAPEKQTLEQFYLNLMKQPSASPGPAAVAPGDPAGCLPPEPPPPEDGTPPL